MHGFGISFDIASKSIRQWYVGEDGVKRWLYSDQPCSYSERLDADFNKFFGKDTLPQIPPPDPLASVEAADGIATMESDE